MKIAVIGSMNMDMIVHADRIPLKGETIRGSEIEYQPGGKGANQAVAMAKLGADVSMFGCIGDDAAGARIIDNMKNFNIDMQSVQILKGIPTGQAIITVGESDNTIIIIAGANNYVDIDYVEANQKAILDADMIVLQNEIPQETVEHIIHLCYKYGKVIVWNPAPARKSKEELLNMVSYITPNEHEVGIIWEKEAENIEVLLKKYAGKLIVTQGEKGVTIYQNEKGLVTIPAMKVEVKDTTGAGDTLNGAFCVGLSRQMDQIEALKFASIAAGLSVQRCGAQAGMPDAAAVEGMRDSILL